ncbi:MAG: hypothetical protein ACLRYE_00745 [Gemmiger formicilis]|uniref:hypothetical protein n=1 Tax=Gemmiger formicilis TaxID=745368 RepID=UPI0039A00FF2
MITRRRSAWEVLMLDSHFSQAGATLSQELVQTGAVGKIAGFAVYESNNMDFENANRVAPAKRLPPTSSAGTRTGLPPRYGVAGPRASAGS